MFEPLLKNSTFLPDFSLNEQSAQLILYTVAQRRKRGPLDIFGVGASVDCCHCLTIFYLY